jgi:putative endonuclease
MFKFYILYSETAEKFYVGHTGDEISERLRKHNSMHKGYTGKFNDWKIVHIECLNTKSEAYRREREVKSWKSKQRIMKLLDDRALVSEHPA